MENTLLTRRALWALCGVFLLTLVSPAPALNVAVPYVKADFMWAQGYTGSSAEIGIIDLHQADID